jgi:predicted DNA binding CopG/RHH family protein
MTDDRKSRTAYKNQFIAENYDRINLTVPRGRKEAIQERAARKNLSANAYINQLIEQDMKKGED